MMKNLLFVLILISCTTLAQSQGVHLGDTSQKAKALLEVAPSSTATPKASDVMIIPRLSNFPSTNPTQDGLLIFFRGDAIRDKGFYYWDTSINDWLKITDRANDNPIQQFKTLASGRVYVGDIYNSLSQIKWTSNMAHNGFADNITVLKKGLNMNDAIFQLFFSTPMPDANYSVLITLGSTFTTVNGIDNDNDLTVVSGDHRTTGLSIAIRKSNQNTNQVFVDILVYSAH